MRSKLRASKAEAPAAGSRCLDAERQRGRRDVFGGEGLEDVPAGGGEVTFPCEPKRMGAQGLLEHRARETGVSERLASLGSLEHGAKLGLRLFGEPVFELGCEATGDPGQLVSRVVGKDDLAREA